MLPPTDIFHPFILVQEIPKPTDPELEIVTYPETTRYVRVFGGYASEGEGILASDRFGDGMVTIIPSKHGSGCNYQIPAANYLTGNIVEQAVALQDVLSKEGKSFEPKARNGKGSLVALLGSFGYDWFGRYRFMHTFTLLPISPVAQGLLAAVYDAPQKLLNRHNEVHLFATDNDALVSA